MPKEEKQLDVKTGRVRRKAIFGDEENESGDSDEDDEEMSDGDRLENGSSDDEAEEEEEDAEMTKYKYITVKGVKRQKLELEEDSEVDLPAFADSDDDLERSSGEEGAAEEADESSEEDSRAERERCILESKGVGKASEARLLPGNCWSDHLNLEKSLLMEKAPPTSDSGHCTAEEVFASEDESEESSSLSSEEEDSENGEVIREKLCQAGSGQKLESENLIDETSDIEDLLKEEEDYKEENHSIETSGKTSSTETSSVCEFNLLLL
jgi:ribosome biogenesis protein BMS1